MSLFFAGQGVTPNLNGQVTNVVTLRGGQVYPLPSTWLETRTGKYTSLQEIDPITGCWRAVGAGGTGASLDRIKSDGFNYRLANQTGCVVGALLTAAGSGYATAPTVTAADGNPIFRAVVGGAVATAVTITNGGTGYTYAPIVEFAVPPAGGVQATGYCTLSSGAVASITVTDQGAGYSQAPTIVLVNDPREGQNNIPVGINASAIATLTGAGTITAILCIDHGNPIASVTTPPVITIAGGGGTGAAATAIMCWSITQYTVTSGGVGYANPVILGAYGGFPVTASAYTNVSTQSQWVKGRGAMIVAAQSAGAIVAAGQNVLDGGIYPGVPTYYAYGYIQGAGATAAVLGLSMGSQIDISVVLTT